MLKKDWTCTVSGHVSNANTSPPVVEYLQGVQVTNEFGGSAITDANGYYIITEAIIRTSDRKIKLTATDPSDLYEGDSLEDTAFDGENKTVDFELIPKSSQGL